MPSYPPSREPLPVSAPERCVSCSEELTTPFCAQCGEQRASDRRYSLVQFGEEILESFANFDGALLRTVRTLITRPGELTAAYMRGERMRYTKPLQLFVLVSVASFLAAVVTNVHTFDTPLRVHIAQWSKPAHMVAQRIAERHVTLAQYAAVFDQASTTQAKTLVIIMVPVFALLVALVEMRKRRYALQHLVFALHSYTALLIMMMATDLMTLYPLNLLLRYGARLLHTTGDGALSLVDVIAVFVYLLLALRRAYLDRRLAAPIKALALAVGMVVILFAYRVVLFYTTFWTT
ncbi:MAG: DUF3667 domain-containing protein [bacterium]